MSKLITQEELAARRESQALIAAAESTLEGAEVADRERSGLLMRSSGTLVRKRRHDGVYVSAVKSVGFGVSGTSKPQVPCSPAPEVRAWDAMVKADRMLVAAGCNSRLVKVVKAQGPKPVTLAESAHIIVVPGPMVAPDTDQPIDIMGRLKAAMVAVSEPE